MIVATIFIDTKDEKWWPKIGEQNIDPSNFFTSVTTQRIFSKTIVTHSIFEPASFVVHLKLGVLFVIMSKLLKVFTINADRSKSDLRINYSNSS